MVDPIEQENNREKAQNQVFEANREVSNYEGLNMLTEFLQNRFLELMDLSKKFCSPDAKTIIADMNMTGDQRRKANCTQEDLDKISQLTQFASQIPVLYEMWPRAAKSGSTYYQKNEARMQYWQEYEMKFDIVGQCEKCKASDLLFGAEIGATIYVKDVKPCKFCHDCLKTAANVKYENKLIDAWNKVKPQSGSFPKRAEPGRETEDLPDSSLADKAAMAIAHLVVNITINSVGAKKLQQQSITLT